MSGLPGFTNGISLYLPNNVWKFPKLHYYNGVDISMQVCRDSIKLMKFSILSGRHWQMMQQMVSLGQPTANAS
jgi:hypothetical protein